jgi:hypothetical protein
VNGKSAGQLLHEALYGQYAHWDKLQPADHRNYENAAATVLNEQLQLARQGRADLEKRMLDLASEYGDATENDEVDGHVPGSLYMAIRAEVLNAVGAQIRKGLDV